MIQNFFAIAFRHLLKNKTYTFLNIFGLSVGLACFTLIGLWVKHEMSYDRFHAKADRLFRVAGIYTDESGKFDQAVTPTSLGPALISDLPEVEDALRIDVNDAVVKFNEKQFVEEDILGVDPSFLSTFSFKLIKGDATTALKEPYNIVISESMAKKYFGDADPINESLRIFQYDPNGQGAEFKITGVIEDCPENSHLHYNFLFSFNTIEVADPDSFGPGAWFNNGFYTYILLEPGASAISLETKFPVFLEKYMGKEMKQYRMRYDYFLQPIADIHLKSHLRYELKPTSSVSYVVVFGTIGCIVLLLACINYINLSTAFSADRFKEVGVRKVMGALRKQLITQYLTESWMLSILSLLVALVWIEISRPLFEALTGKEIVDLYTASTMMTLILIASLVGLISGIYPSVVLSSFRTVNILKGQFKSGASGVWMRKTLVILQYSITIILITGILVVQLQLRFIQNKDLGFDKENLLVLNVNGSNEVHAGFEGFAQELLTNPSIAGIARSNSMISGGLGNSGATAEDPSGKKVNATVYRLRVDHDYMDVYKMKLLAGRNFIEGSASDSTSGFIVNEATTKIFGYQEPNDIIGKYFQFNGLEGTILGVVKDFHYTSLQQKIEPTCMYLLRGRYSRIAVRLNGDLQTNLDLVLKTWKKYFPSAVLDYAFAEDRLQDQYQSEERFSKIFLIFSIISMVIACLGLFALVSYSVESRTKEIGIRKVLGASATTIVNMLSKEFILLVAIACVIAIPSGYYFMQQWLQDFAYHVDISAEIFLFAGVIALAIALVTISIKSIRAALANPVDSLRNE